MAVTMKMVLMTEVQAVEVLMDRQMLLEDQVLQVKVTTEETDHIQTHTIWEVEVEEPVQ